MSIIYKSKDFITGEQDICAFFCMARQKEAVHSHEFWELTYVYEGEGINYTGSEEYTVSNGEFLFIKPETEHTFILQQQGMSGDVKMLNCLFTEEYFAELLKSHSEIKRADMYSLYKMLFDNKDFCIHLPDDTAQNVKKLMWLIEYEFSHFTDSSQVIIDNAAASLLIIIMRLYEFNINKKTPSVSRNEAIKRLIKYINSNFSQKLSLSFLAEYVHLSREYLSRYFKAYTGENISDYLLNIRMSHAKELLAIPEYSVEDIASYCGYPTLSNFQRAFKSYAGMSPSGYRKSI